MVPLFMPGSWVCKAECDLKLAPKSGDTADEGNGLWASQVLCIVPAIECIQCPCSGIATCVGAAYSYLDYSERYTFRTGRYRKWEACDKGWVPENIEAVFPGHRWRALKSRD